MLWHKLSTKKQNKIVIAIASLISFVAMILLTLIEQIS